MKKLLIVFIAVILFVGCNETSEEIANDPVGLSVEQTYGLFLQAEIDNYQELLTNQNLTLSDRDSLLTQIELNTAILDVLVDPLDFVNRPRCTACPDGQICCPSLRTLRLNDSELSKISFVDEGDLVDTPSIDLITSNCEDDLCDYEIPSNVSYLLFENMNIQNNTVSFTIHLME